MKTDILCDPPGRQPCHANQEIFFSATFFASRQQWFDKLWKFELGSVLGAQWTLSPHLGALCSGCSWQNRAPVSSPRQTQQRISVFLSQHFPLHKQQRTLSHAKPNKWQTTWFLYVALKFKKKKKKLAKICLNVVSDVWYFLLKADSSESTEKKSLIRWTAHHS